MPEPDPAPALLRPVRVWIEPPPGWGPTRVMLVQLGQLGYSVEEHRIVGQSILVITG